MPTQDIQSECRRRQMQKIQNMENKQLRILLGVCTLFVMCHTCRIIRNFEDLYLRLSIGTDEDDRLLRLPCSEGCASPMKLLSHVSTWNVHYMNVALVQ